MRVLRGTSRERWLEIAAAFGRSHARFRRRCPRELLDEVDRFCNRDADGHGFAINRALRSGAPPTGDMRTSIERMDAAFRRAPPMPEGTVLYRGVGEFPQLERGNEIAFDGFTSTSPLAARAFLYVGKNRGVLLRLRPAPGQKHVWSPFEEEVVLPRGTRWRVADVEQRRVAFKTHPADPGVDYSDVYKGSVWLVTLEPQRP